MKLPRATRLFVRIGRRQMYLWRAIDGEGEILDMLVQGKRDKAAAVRLMRKLMKKQGTTPAILITDRLSAYGAAVRELGLTVEHVQGKRRNNRIEGSHVPIRRRERQMQGFRYPGSAQRFLAVQAAVTYTFNTSRHLISAKLHRQFQNEALAAWQEAATLAT